MDFYDIEGDILLEIALFLIFISFIKFCLLELN